MFEIADNGRIKLQLFSVREPSLMRMVSIRGLPAKILKTAGKLQLPLNKNELRDINEMNYIELPYTLKGVMDSGCMGVYTNDERHCVPGSVCKIDNPISIKGAYGNIQTAHYAGTLILKSNTGGSEVILLPNTPIIKGLKRTLIGITPLDDAGYYCDYGGGV